LLANKPLNTDLLDCAIARDYAMQGDALLFHTKAPKNHEWHYRGLADALRELQDTFAYKEFEKLIKK